MDAPAPSGIANGWKTGTPRISPSAGTDAPTAKTGVMTTDPTGARAGWEATRRAPATGPSSTAGRTAGSGKAQRENQKEPRAAPCAQPGGRAFGPNQAPPPAGRARE